MANAINGVVADFDEVLRNRKKFLKKVGVDVRKTICMWVTHGDEIVEADTELAGVSMLDYKYAVKVDGLMTNKKGMFLFLLIADCLPIIIYDSVAEAVGLIHAGWRGVDKNIAGKAILKFKSKFKSKAGDIVVGIGPCARKESFVKEDPLQLNDPKWREFLKHRNNNSYEIDLIGFTKKQLIDAGVKKENIFESGIDTVKDKRFFSHYREGMLPIEKQGRFACVVGLK